MGQYKEYFILTECLCKYFCEREGMRRCGCMSKDYSEKKETYSMPLNQSNTFYGSTHKDIISIVKSF